MLKVCLIGVILTLLSQLNVKNMYFLIVVSWQKLVSYTLYAIFNLLMRLGINIVMLKNFGSDKSGLEISTL